MYLGNWKIDDDLTFVCNTHTPSTGVATDADSVPVYRIYKDETGTPILTGNTAKLDDANTVGYYSEQIVLSAANGLEKGKTYTIYITATVGGIVGTMSHTFQIVNVDITDIYDQNEEIKGSGFTSSSSLALRALGGGGGGHCAWYDADLKRAKDFFTTTPLKMEEITDALAALSKKLLTPNDAIIDSVTATNTQILKDFIEVKNAVDDLATGLKTTDSILLSIADAETLEGLLDGE